MIFQKYEAWLSPTDIFDHARYINEYMKEGIDCYTSIDTVNHLKLNSHRVNIIANQIPVSIGDFKIMPFDAVHDLPCLGFLISHSEMGKLVFITDSAYVPVKFNNVSHYCVEANYDDPLLSSDRVIGRHMSISTCLNFLKSTNLTKTYNIILLHLSAGSSDAKQFIKSVQSIAPNANVQVADKGLTVQLINNPF